MQLLFMNADFFRKKLGLEPHPEGGEYIPFYASEDLVNTQSNRYGSLGVPRKAGTSIYYQLQGTQFSAFHVLKSDEIWHYYTGNTAINLFMLNPKGNLTNLVLGNPALIPGASFQIFFKAGMIFAGELQSKHPDDFALIGCTVSPGFTFEDFRIVPQKELLNLCPQHKELIIRLSANEL